LASDTNLESPAPSAVDLLEHTRTRSGSGSMPLPNKESIAEERAHLRDHGYYVATTIPRRPASRRSKQRHSGHCDSNRHHPTIQLHP
jgi:hypothetical protein